MMDPRDVTAGASSGAAEGEPGTTDRDAVVRRLAELLGGGSPVERALVDRFLHGFDAKAGRLIAGWAAALDAGDTARAVREVHTLTGSALNLGSVRLAATCREAEAWTAALAPGRAADPAAPGWRRRLEAEAAEFSALLLACATAGPVAGGGPAQARAGH